MRINFTVPLFLCVCDGKGSDPGAVTHCFPGTLWGTRFGSRFVGLCALDLGCQYQQQWPSCVTLPAPMTPVLRMKWLGPRRGTRTCPKSHRYLAIELGLSPRSPSDEQRTLCILGRVLLPPYTEGVCSSSVTLGFPLAYTSKRAHQWTSWMGWGHVYRTPSPRKL